eukprot:CAMPEP_0201870852 /NCGR_PEP_ID=MMETSP0902-20130614/3897_1 /ASSEMBLY_ACC=CAM_ASM_000551 /TAXON_ID=420261 /ORGANISM="Thalassiosira antarctica, Strain CCMP982" /LENGTH=228 /DNA_ID=CAMNT_0048396639 /DNA_START=73 /DNA_END=759 /DNA_ORIENTATION=-
MTAMKRQASYIYAHAHNDSTACASNKRRRQNEEPQYTAATIVTALANAGSPPMSIFTGRRERALPLGSVDMDLARVMTSSEFDRDEAAEMAGDDQQQVEEKDGETTQDDDPYGYGDVSSMYMMAGLIQSTRHHYCLDSDDTTSTTNTLPNNISSDDYSNYNTSNTEQTPSEDNSEGLSSWTPSSSCNDLNDNDKENIDNDNWSDGQSNSSQVPKDGEQEGSLSFSIVG